MVKTLILDLYNHFSPHLDKYVPQIKTLIQDLQNDFGPCLYNYVPQMVVYSICCFFLEYPNTPFLQLTCGNMFVWFWIYFIHRWFHTLPSTGIFYYINWHMAFHHAKDKPLTRPIELIVEFLQNVVWVFYLYFLQELTGIHIVPTKIIVLGAFLLASVHIITYSIFGSEKHAMQHLHPDFNFGPDYLDHLFGTNYDKAFEDMTHYIPNTLIITALIYFFM